MYIPRPSEPKKQAETPAPAASATGFSPVDAAIAATLLAVTTGVGVGFGWHLRQEANRLDRERMASLGRTQARRAALQHTEAHRAALSQVRMEVEHYMQSVVARPMVPWTTAVGELSRSRPHGVWTTHLHGEGAHFRADVKAARPDLAAAYAGRLRESPYVEFASLPAGTAPSTTTQVAGRWSGE